MPQRLISLDGEDPWYNGDVYAYLTTVSVKLEKSTCLEKELGDNEIGSSVYFLFEMYYVF